MVIIVCGPEDVSTYTNPYFNQEYTEGTTSTWVEGSAFGFTPIEAEEKPIECCWAVRYRVVPVLAVRSVRLHALNALAPQVRVYEYQHPT